MSIKKELKIGSKMAIQQNALVLKKMNKKFFRPYGSTKINILARFMLGGVFVYASFYKVVYPFEFSKTINNYMVLPDFLINFTAITLPWIELFSGLFLIYGIFIRSSAILLSSLLIIFMVVIGINVIRGIDLSCGCFSMSSYEIKSNGLLLIIRDSLMLVLGISLIFPEKKDIAIQNSSCHTLS